jgi:hypothetical protein
MPAEGQKEAGLTPGVFKNSLKLWRERYKALRPQGPAEQVHPKKLKLPRKKVRRACRPR